MTSKQSLENSLKRLEEILSKMQEATLPLEESLKLYEEANQLVTFSFKTLTDAERRVESLIKTREGSLELSPEGEPKLEPFN